MDPAHGDLLHQLLVVCVERVEPMDLDVLSPVRRRVAQGHQRIELRQGLHRGLALHLLRLVQNEDRAVAGDHVDGAAGLEIVQFVVNTAVSAPRALNAWILITITLMPASEEKLSSSCRRLEL